MEDGQEKEGPRVSLDDLTEADLHDLTGAARGIVECDGEQKYLGMSDAGILLEVMADRVHYQRLVTRLENKGVLIAVLGRSGWPHLLQCVREGLRDRDVCMAAVKACGSCLEDVPEWLRDWDMCLAAVRGNGLCLEDVPDHLRDREMCLEALLAAGSKDWFCEVLQFVPEDLIRDVVLRELGHDRPA